MKSLFRFVGLTAAALVLTSLLAQAQTSASEATRYNLLARRVQRYYNQNQVDSLYAMAADSVQRKTSLDSMKGKIRNMRSEMGQWKSMKLEDISNGTAHYTATFEHSTHDFYLGQLNQDGRIGSMNFVGKD